MEFHFTIILSLTRLLPLFSLSCQLLFRVPLYQQRPRPWLATT